MVSGKPTTSSSSSPALFSITHCTPLGSFRHSISPYHPWRAAGTSKNGNMNVMDDDIVELEKHNILVRETALLAKELACLLNFPFVIADATTLNQASPPYNAKVRISGSMVPDEQPHAMLISLKYFIMGPRIDISLHLPTFSLKMGPTSVIITLFCSVVLLEHGLRQLLPEYCKLVLRHIL
ncbi:hypothetical protein L2E82_10971 [Cichorium intybus]|uniref:Uncharacterized protein n=1 Tax=Cichorium intybus TaxID=13427 RepID=A0ACB9GC30_CICIN|nr:hypothetical protein L2E82_10971 [Cichorium intybus]